MKYFLRSFIFIFLIFSLSKCTNDKEVNTKSSTEEISRGKLFIIGGGHKPQSLIKAMTHLAGVDTAGYIIILPMSSSEIDTAVFYGTKQFNDLGLFDVHAFNIQSEDDMTNQILDSVKNASLIYISGGDQNKFMSIVGGSKLYNAMHIAYKNGAMISGTSAGAAVMSQKMITGNEYKYPEYTGDFRTIEANNIELAKGMGFLETIIIDQHFIWRMRMNRLISACLENPECECIGIDESTALLISNDIAVVYGESQVIRLKHTENETQVVNGLLGAKNLCLDIFLPGDTFKIKN
jgi:cyanophycinase